MGKVAGRSGVEIPKGKGGCGVLSIQISELYAPPLVSVVCQPQQRLSMFTHMIHAWLHIRVLLQCPPFPCVNLGRCYSLAASALPRLSLW